MQLIRSLLRLSFALPLLLAGCSSVPTVSSDAKPGQDFSSYKRFALLPLPEVKVESDPGVMLRVGEPARKTVVEVLTAKGFVQSELAQADFSVNLTGQSIPRTELSTLGYGGGFRYPAYSQTDVYHYDERTLTVEIYDQRSKEQVWVGWIKKDSYDPVEAQKVCEGLRLILAKFPPTAPAPAAKH